LRNSQRPISVLIGTVQFTSGIKEYHRYRHTAGECRPMQCCVTFLQPDNNNNVAMLRGLPHTFSHTSHLNATTGTFLKRLLMFECFYCHNTAMCSSVGNSLRRTQAAPSTQSECTGCRQQGHADGKTLLQKCSSS